MKAVEEDLAGNLSPVVEKTFVKIENQQFPVAADIAAFNAMEDGTEATLTLNNAQVLFVGTNDIYVRDASAAIDFYRTGLIFSPGQVLNGQVTGKSTRYYDTPEMAKTDNTNADNITATSGTAIAKVVTIAQAKSPSYYCDLIKVQGVQLAEKQEGNYTNVYAYIGSDSIQVYDKFKVGFGEWNTTVTLSMGTTDATSLSGLDNSTPLTQVWQGTMNANMAQIDIVLDSPFDYSGGSLLLDIVTTAATYKSSSFAGATVTGASWYSYSQCSALVRVPYP